MSRIVLVFCLLGMIGIPGMGMAGNLDAGGTPPGEDTAFFGDDSVGFDTDAVTVPPARVPRTGQTISYGPRDDGALRKGVAWPNPRFTDNADGTIKDNLTGLVWLRIANCTRFYSADSTGANSRTWSAALTAANKLKNGYCGLYDGSTAGSWRLPSLRELHSLVDYGFSFPALPNRVGMGRWSEGDPFSGVPLGGYYWSSSSVSPNPALVWQVDLTYGNVANDVNSVKHYVWPVRTSR